MGKLISLDFWFNTRPGNMDAVGLYILAAILIILFLSAIISGIYKKRQKGLYYKVWKGANSFSWANFIIGLFLLFFAYEMIYFLSMRFWFLAWFLSMFAWKMYILKNALKIPEIRKKIEEEKVFKKYIP
jgi:hypothetical protein